MALSDDTKHILIPRFKTFAPLVKLGIDMTGIALVVNMVTPATLPAAWTIDWVDRAQGWFRPTYAWDATFGGLSGGEFYVSTADHAESWGPFLWRRV